MMNKQCPLCDKNLNSGIGFGCKMCGMPIDKGEFCSDKCRKLYKDIYKNKKKEAVY